MAYEIVSGPPLKRGDARADGRIDITDALFIAQYLAGLRQVGDSDSEVHAVNGASVRPDGDAGDMLTITDALLSPSTLPASGTTLSARRHSRPPVLAFDLFACCLLPLACLR